MAELTTKEATERILRWIPKLNELELTKISSAIKHIRKSRTDKINGASELNFGTDGKA